MQRKMYADRHVYGARVVAGHASKLIRIDAKLDKQLARKRRQLRKLRAGR